MNAAPRGLTNAEIQALRAQYGRNAIPAQPHHPLLVLAARLWGPVPWLLEVTLALTLATARYGDSAAIGFLLLFNAIAATIQEGRARNAVELLRKKVTVAARALRDGVWSSIPSEELVPGDLVHVNVGSIIPADVRLIRGTIASDESTLTGESLARTIPCGDAAFAGSTVVRGDADALVTAIGTQTKFGKTVELFRTTHARGELERFVLRLVTSLSVIGVAIIAIVTAIAVRASYDPASIAIFAIMILLASVPIALPAAFTLATTLGSLELVRRGALVTRLSALEDAASMDVLCTDKTGTITANRMSVVACAPFGAFSDADIAAFAAAASDEAGADPLDTAVLRFAEERHATPLVRKLLVPFDPVAKRSSAQIVVNASDAVAIKGAPDVLRALASRVPEDFDQRVHALAAEGRVLAVALTHDGTTELAGLFAIADPPRDDAAALIGRLHAMGIDVALVTGDTAATALHVAHAVGIPEADVHASVYPDGKVAIITRLQQAGHVVGMTGDGINDAPALRAAGIGIAVASATDAAKAAAGIILTAPGLADIVTAIETSRTIFARMTTYTMMKLVKYLEIVGILSVGFALTHLVLLTPELMVALLVFNDGVTLAIATDNATPVRRQTVWSVATLLRAAIGPALGTTLSVTIAIVLAAHLHALSLAQLRSVVFLAIVTMGQFSVYLVRQRPGDPLVPPSRPLAISTVAAIAAACAMVLTGTLAATLPSQLVVAVVATLAAFGAMLFAVFAILARRDGSTARHRSSSGA